jgi:hypothetical protein
MEQTEEWYHRGENWPFRIATRVEMIEGQTRKKWLLLGGYLR